MRIGLVLEQHKREIINDYVANKNAAAIARKFGTTTNTLLTFLRKHNVDVDSKQTSEAEKGQIWKLHAQNVSANKIAKQLGISRAAVTNYLKTLSVDISHKKKTREDPLINHKDEIIDLYKQGGSSVYIAKKFNTGSNSIRRYLKQWGVKLRSLKQIPVDETFFDKIDTEDKAYILGFWYADGYNNATGKYIVLPITDKDILYEIAKRMKYGGKIREYPRLNKSKKQIYTFQVSSKKMSDALSCLGCSQGKTYNAKFPTPDQVPDHLMRHFVRGLSDGDGCIYVDKEYKVVAKITGTKDICNGLQKYLQEELDIKSGVYVAKVNEKTGYITYRILIGANKENTDKYLHWLYHDATIFLQRKYDKAMQSRCISP